MPSGSHSTSGGSHSSGGSSSSRSSFGGGGGSSHSSHHHFHHGRLYINGRPAGPKASIAFLVMFLILFSGMWAFGGFMIGAQRQQALNKVKADYEYYQNMIDFAKQNNSPTTQYIITGTVTGKFLSEYNNKWYLSYSFQSAGGQKYHGETYAIYSQSDVSNIIPNVTTIQLAADSYIITETTDTINMDYENTTLNDDGYYVSIKNSMLSPQILCFVVAGGSAILFISMIVKEVKNLKNKNSFAETLTNNNQSLNSETSNKTETTMQSSSQANYCVYCCSEVPEGKSKCPNCGARIK